MLPINCPSTMVMQGIKERGRNGRPNPALLPREDVMDAIHRKVKPWVQKMEKCLGSVGCSRAIQFATVPFVSK